ncbi:MAG: NAD-dependent deacylase [Chloroflexi bacterium]|nr:NAD-dependent deacylase [Chloroflexota bacterium]MDL1885042.1 NAD-dependent deacylase [Anaerolineae bacterium CFX8]
MMNPDLLQRAGERLLNSRSLAVLTGAGISKESGVPTFRDALDGLWARYDPAQLATPGAFARNPKLVWDWYEYRREMVRAAQPNPGHYALTALQKRFPHMRIITQNVDDLHERAGSAGVIRLHGSIAANRCFFDCQGSPTPVDISTLTWDKNSGPPCCPHCGRWVRPDVVWFGEMLPPDAIESATFASAHADVMLVVGTSGVVTPAANMPFIAKRAGAFIIEINPVESQITPIADIWLAGPSGEVLPRLVEALGAP